VSPKTDSTRLVNAVALSCAPTESVLVSGDRFNHNVALNASQLLELFGHSIRLETALRLKTYVLEVTPPTSARSRVGTWWLHPVG
jgi:hypothetical protein